MSENDNFLDASGIRQTGSTGSITFADEAGHEFDLPHTQQTVRVFCDTCSRVVRAERNV